MEHTKLVLCTAAGMLGSVFTTTFGGWSGDMTTLLVLMIADFLSAWVVAGVFKASPKTETGALESKAGWKGLAKKAMTLFFVLIAHRLDLALQTTFIQNAVCIGFILNECISLIENAGLMGLRLPSALTEAIDLLQKKADADSE